MMIRELVESMPQLIWTGSSDGRCDYLSPQWLAYTGEEYKAEVAQLWDRYVHPEDRDRIRSAWQIAIAHTAAFDVECRLRRRDGMYLWFRCIGVPLLAKNRDVSSWLCTCTEIEASKSASRAIERLNAELEERIAYRTAQLTAAVGELEAFCYSVSHDLRAPLRSLEGFSRILLEDYSPTLDSEAVRLLNILRDESLRMGRLIDELLRFSRLGRQDLQKSEVDMQALAMSVIEKLEDDMKPTSESFHVGELPLVRGDAEMLRQVWVNLINNAQKFTRPKAHPSIQIGAATSDNSDIFYVRDNGVGFDSKYSAKLFRVFQRLHAEDEFEGTGVGLAIVERIVRRHGGRVWAEGALGEGATFCFSLPRDGTE